MAGGKAGLIAMGVLYTDFALWDRDLTQSITLNGLVDTGSLHTLIPESVLAELGISRLGTLVGRLSDGSRRTFDLGRARLVLPMAAGDVDVIFGKDPEVVQIGATTLEKLRLAVDLNNSRLIPLDGG